MMRNAVRRLIPKSFRMRLARRRQIAANVDGSLLCPVCQNAVKSFLPHGNPPLADILCPICGSKACHRLAWVWFVQNLHLFRADGVFVHVAPERELGAWIEERCNASAMRYIHGEIRDKKHRIDVLDMKFASDSVDVFFACHVLNMVTRDDVAISEIFRVLKPGGIAILPVPIHSYVSSMIEADRDSTQSERQNLFNDPFMFRKYTATEYRSRLEAAGFTASDFRAADVADDRSEQWRLCNEWVQTAAKPKQTVSKAVLKK